MNVFSWGIFLSLLRTKNKPIAVRPAGRSRRLFELFWHATRCTQRNQFSSSETETVSKFRRSLRTTATDTNADTQEHTRQTEALISQQSHAISNMYSSNHRFYFVRFGLARFSVAATERIGITQQAPKFLFSDKQFSK